MGKLYDPERLRIIATICIDIARGLIVAGAGTARVEETVHHIGVSCQVPIESQVTPTSIVVSVGSDRPVTRICRVRSRTIDLDKLVDLNKISRQICDKEITIHAARLRIAQILARKPLYSDATIYWGQALCCAGFAVILGGGAKEIPPALLEGLFAQYLLVKLGHMPMFLCAFVSAITTTLAAVAIHYVFPIVELEPILLAGIVPLLPGLALANAVVDLMAGELTAGVARTTEALLCAAALASGAIISLNVSTLL